MQNLNKSFRLFTGYLLHELGGRLEQIGSRLTYDIGYRIPMNRNKQILPVYSSVPQVILKSNQSLDKRNQINKVIAPNSQLIGNVILGLNSEIKEYCTINAFNSNIFIGENCFIDKFCQLITLENLPQMFQKGIVIGNNVKIGQGSSLSSCIIDDDVVIGKNCVISEGVQIERNSIVPDNTYIAPGKLYKSVQQQKIQ